MLALTPKEPRTHGFKMTNLIDHIVKNIIRMGPSFLITRATEEHCMCLPKQNKNMDKEKSLYDHSKLLKKT